MRFIYGLIFCLLSLSARAELTNVTNVELQALMESGVPVVDVRRADEWAETGIIAGSHKLTFFDKNGDYNANKWLEQLSEITDKDQPVILICQTGVRSKVVSNWLSNGLGYAKIYNVTDGISAWINSGQPTSKE